MSASRKSHENGCQPMWNFKLRLKKVHMRVPLAATRVGACCVYAVLSLMLWPPLTLALSYTSVQYYTFYGIAQHFSLHHGSVLVENYVGVLKIT